MWLTNTMQPLLMHYYYPERMVDEVRTSVSRIVGELIERGLVAEKRQRRGGMGKPPTELELSPRSAFSVGLDLDRDGLRLG